MLSLLCSGEVVQIADGQTDKASERCKNLLPAGAVRIKWPEDKTYGETGDIWLDRPLLASIGNVVELATPLPIGIGVMLGFASFFGENMYILDCTRCTSESHRGTSCLSLGHPQSSGIDQTKHTHTKTKRAHKTEDQ